MNLLLKNDLYSVKNVTREFLWNVVRRLRFLTDQAIAEVNLKGH